MKKTIFLFVAFLIVGISVVPGQDTARLQQLARETEQLAADFQAGNISLQQFQQRAAELNQQVEAARRSYDSSGASFCQAQLQRLETLFDQDKSLESQYNEGRLSEADYSIQINAVRNELNQIIAPFLSSPSAAIQLSEVEEKIRKLWPGDVLGWPPTTVNGDRSYLEISGLSRPIRQAVNTRASYSFSRSTFNSPISGYTIYMSGANQAAFDDLRRQIESITGQTMEKMSQQSASNGYNLYVSKNVDADGTHWYHYHEIIFGNSGTISYAVNDSAYD